MALQTVAFAALVKMQVGKGEDLSRTAAPEEKTGPGAASSSSGQALGVPKAGVFAGPLSPSYRGSRRGRVLGVPRLRQGSDPICW